MHAFIVRPFGTKNGIDFDRVEKELIMPALKEAGFSGGTTAEFIQQGNIRTDMFEQLLIADLVVADISIHNANVFYELGIRHAFRDTRTFLIRSRGDDVPFDLKTDRYLLYDADDPAASLEALVEGLMTTWDSQKRDSPVFQLLPGLEPTDPSKFLLMPLDFREEVEQAESAEQRGKLQLLSAEVEGFAWRKAALRLIGNCQFRLQDWRGAEATCRALRNYDEMDQAANTLLGTIYQRLGDLVRSDQALERVLQDTDVTKSERAEAFALIGRNAKTRWEADWQGIEVLDALQSAALSSPHLESSFDAYRKGFIEDRNHYYSGLNALAMLTMTTELADAQPSSWGDAFESKSEASMALRKLKALRSDLAAGVRLSIHSKRAALAREDKTGFWAEISNADLTLLTSSKPARVARAYKAALGSAPDFAAQTVRAQLLRQQALGILQENTKAALDSIAVEGDNATQAGAPPRVILFIGHRLDAKGRETPRFPADHEAQARAMILEAVSNEKQKSNGELLGIAGGANGGDILFHEVCEELNIPTKMYLVIPKNEYIKTSVVEAGAEWVERFKRLFDSRQPAVEILSDSVRLPKWLRGKRGYDIWQRSNLWVLHSALEISKDNLTLIALWNGEVGDGPGGTEDMVERAQDRGATFVHLDARELTR